MTPYDVMASIAKSLDLSPKEFGKRWFVKGPMSWGHGVVVTGPEIWDRGETMVDVPLLPDEAECLRRYYDFNE